MTWGETDYTQAKGNGQRDKKVAVSPSRPMTRQPQLACWAARLAREPIVPTLAVRKQAYLVTGVSV